MSKEILDNVTETPEVNLPETEMDGTTPVELPQRVNPFCVISKSAMGVYQIRDIQTNSGWSENPYPDYVIVPDEMVPEILETRGFCDIVLNDDATEVVSFTAREIPDIQPPKEDKEPTADDVINAMLGLEV